MNVVELRSATTPMENLSTDTMPQPALSPDDVQRLNARFAAAPPIDILRWAVDTFRPGVALTSSFGARSAAILHMAVQVDPQISVRLVDTGFLFPETLQFMQTLKERFHLNLQIFRTSMDVETFKREHADMPVEHPDYCCGEYKIEATRRALAGLRCWLTGLRRTDAVTRAATPFVEVLDNGLVKVSPLAAWTAKDVHQYMVQHDLPYHPLFAQGYTSIGCYPCTQKPVDPNNPRSGRWVGQNKTECGIHDLGKTLPLSQ
jgi:phosphoadenosine phosphosulfate reductase